MKILFSPVGTADPISALGDGPMLHIIRHYAPEKVTLYFSPKMMEYQRDDEHFTEAIKLLRESTGQPLPEIEVVESAIEEVHRYDLYIKEFEDILCGLRLANPDAEILVNVTSGTPAMEAALVAIDAFGRYNLQAIQVDTPRKGPNKTRDRADHASYDLATYWECNEDGKTAAENRCHEIESANFADLILRDNIRALVEDYDYVAALHLAQQCTSLNLAALNLIEGCVYRMLLNHHRAAECFKQTKLPGPGPKLSEYLALLEIYLAREQWADYLRAFTPAFFQTCMKRVRMHVCDEEWTYIRKRDGTLCVARKKIESRLKIYTALLDHHSGFLPTGPVNSSICCGLLGAYESEEALSPYRRLRDMEGRVRNPIAHSVVRIDKEKLEKEAGITFEESLDLLFDLNGVKRGLYANINERILELL